MSERYTVTSHASSAVPRPLPALLLLALLGSALVAGYIWMASAANISRTAPAIGNYIWIFAGLFVLYLIASFFVLRWAHILPLRPTLIVIGLVAVTARGILVFAPPTLSNDIYRYIWDGRVMSAGISPYAFSPNAPQVEPLHPPGYWLWEFINRKSAVTIYPAGAELFFAASYTAQPDSLEGTKAAISLVDLLNCVLLGLVLWQLGLHAVRVLIYAWAPLPIVEFASSGHIEAVAVFWTLLALLAGVVAVKKLQSGNPRGGRFGLLLASLSIAGAALVKILPLMLLGAWLRRLGWKLAALCVLVVAAVQTGFIWYYGGYISNFLVTYLKDEQFNSPLYAVLSDSLGFLAGIPDGAVRIALGVAFAGVLLWTVLKRDDHPYSFITKSFILVGAYFLLGTSLHPWYATWLLLFVPLFLPPGGLPLFGGDNVPDERTRWRRGEYGPALAALFYCGLTFGGYTIFSYRVNAVPFEVGAIQLIATLGLALAWPLAARFYLRKTKASLHSMEG